MKRKADTPIYTVKSTSSYQKPKLNRQPSKSLIQSRGIKGELKVRDVNVPTNITAGASTFALGSLVNGLSLGNDYDNRIGRKVLWKKIFIRYTGFLTAGSANKVRLLVVYDKQTNGVAPAITDILLADAFNSPNNLNNRDRFLTIIDEITENAGTGDSCIAGTITRKIGLETIFNAGTAGTVADITSGSIHVFICGTGSTGAVDFDMRIRLRFEDQ